MFLQTARLLPFLFGPKLPATHTPPAPAPSSSSSSSSTSAYIIRQSASAPHTRTHNLALTTGKPIRTLCKICSLCFSLLHINFTCHFITHSHSSRFPSDKILPTTQFLFFCCFLFGSIRRHLVSSYRLSVAWPRRAHGAGAVRWSVSSGDARPHTHNSQFPKPKLSKHTFNTMPQWQRLKIVFNVFCKSHTRRRRRRRSSRRHSVTSLAPTGLPTVTMAREPQPLAMSGHQQRCAMCEHTACIHLNSASNWITIMSKVFAIASMANAAAAPDYGIPPFYAFGRIWKIIFPIECVRCCCCFFSLFHCHIRRQRQPMNVWKWEWLSGFAAFWCVKHACNLLRLLLRRCRCRCDFIVRTNVWRWTPTTISFIFHSLAKNHFNFRFSLTHTHANSQTMAAVMDSWLPAT